MSIRQKYHDYKFALAEKTAVEQKFDNAKLDIRYSMDVHTYHTRMYNGMNLPKCINLIFVDTCKEPMVQNCESFDKDLDCPECKNCRHYYRRQNYVQLEKEFEVAQQQAKLARKNLINEIKNIFTLRR